MSTDEQAIRDVIALWHRATAAGWTSVEGVRKLEDQAKKAGKSKMKFHYFRLNNELRIDVA